MELSRLVGFLGATAALSLTGLMAAACGDSGETVADPELAFEQFGDALREAQCSRAARCRISPDVDTCKSTILADAWLTEAVAAASFGDLTYDPKAGKSCVDALEGASCESLEIIPRAIREICDTAFGGRLPVDSACVAHAQCEGLDSACEGSCGGGCCAGTCQGSIAQAQAGEECTDVVFCAPGLRCQFDETAMVSLCTDLAGPNEPCPEGLCVDGYACNPGDGKCFKQAATSASCNPMLANACASWGETCHPEEAICVARPTTGEPCLGGVCALYAYCDGTTCQRLPDVGEDCNGGCIGYLECSEEGTCLSLPGPNVCLSF